MNELLLVGAAVRNWPRLPASISVALHGAAIASFVLLAPIGQVPPIQPYHPPVYLVAPRSGIGSSVTPPKLLHQVTGSPTKGTERTTNILINPQEVKVGPLDRPRDPADRMMQYAGMDDIRVGDLNGKASGQITQFGSIGAFVGPAGLSRAGPAAANATSTLPDRVYEPASLISRPCPSYTEGARKLNITGEVVLQVKMGADGTVRVLKVLKRLGHGLDEEATYAVEHTKCRPARKNNNAVDEVQRIMIIFNLA